MMLLTICNKKLVVVSLLIGLNQIFAVEVLDNNENSNITDTKSNVTKREEISGRARKSSFVFKDDYNDYGDNTGTGYGGDDYYDQGSSNYNQGVRGGRYYEPDNGGGGNKKVKFPADDARESLSSLIDDANKNYGVYSSSNSDSHRVKGGRGLFPFDSNNVEQSQYGSQYNNYESERIRGQDYNSYGQPINQAGVASSSSSSSSQPYKFVDPYSHKNFGHEDPSQEKLQTEEYIQKLKEQQQYLLAQKQKQQYLLAQQQHQQKQQYLLSQKNHGYNPESQVYRPPPGSNQNSNQFLGPYSPEYLQQQYLTSFPSVSHQDIHSRPPSIVNAFPGTFGANQNIHMGPFPPPGNYKLPNGVEISFTPPPGFEGPGSSPIIHSQPPNRPNSPPSTYQHLYERPFQSPYAPDRISHQGQVPFNGQYASQFGNYAQGPINPALLGHQGHPSQYGPGLNQQELGIVGGIGGISGQNGFGNAAFAPQGNRGPFGGLYDTFARQPDGFSRRISRAIEEISKNDDLQCVPKLVCQMVGTRMRNRPLPGFIDVDSLGTLIEAIPVETPSAKYMRAAILGLTNGDRRCYHAYNRCPSNEDDVLYYLNNHRGGFFRFFSGEDNTLNDQNHNQQSQQSNGLNSLLSLLGGSAGQGGNAQSQLNVLALQNIAAALGGANSGFRDPPAQPPSQTSSGGLNLGALSGLASNFQLLSTLGSLFGGTSGRSKETDIQGRQFTPKNDDKDDLSPFKDLDLIPKPKDEPNVTLTMTFQLGQLPHLLYVVINNAQNTFHHQNSLDLDRYSPNQFQKVTPDQIPIKTGTGSLAFSNEQFNNRYTSHQYQQQLQLQKELEELEREQKDRLAEQARLDKLSQFYTNTHRFQYTRPGTSSSNYNRYSVDRYRPGSSNNNYYNNRYTSSSSNNYNNLGGSGAGRIYVTNAQGVNEYYIENGRKHYL
uniref:CSON007617 protein n=1 Tax=Culicoides sonorensis TaxID=179676 RepID=A0A336MYJ3_CULSO